MSSGRVSVASGRPNVGPSLRVPRATALGRTGIRSIERIAMEFGAVGAERMNPSDLGDPHDFSSSTTIRLNFKKKNVFAFC